MPNFSLDTHKRIYDDTTGDYIEICPDADGLDLVEIRSVYKDKIVQRITIHPDSIPLIIEALTFFLPTKKV